MISPLCRAGLLDTPEEFNSAMATPQCYRVEWRMVEDHSLTVQMVTHMCSLCSSARCTRVQSRTGACTILQSLTVQMATLHNVTEWRITVKMATPLHCRVYNVTEWRMLEDQCLTVQMAAPPQCYRVKNGTGPVQMATPPQWVWSYVDAATKAVYGDRQFWLVAMLHSNINERQKRCIHPSTLKYSWKIKVVYTGCNATLKY